VKAPPRRLVLPVGLAVLGLVLWDTFVVYPFRLFVVLFHEISHGLAAVVTGGSIVSIGLRFDEAAPEGSEAAPKTLLETTLQATHQEPVVLPPSPALSDGSVIVTASLLQRHDDLQRVLTCLARRSPSPSE